MSDKNIKYHQSFLTTYFKLAVYRTFYLLLWGWLPDIHQAAFSVPFSNIGGTKRMKKLIGQDKKGRLHHGQTWGRLIYFQLKTEYDNVKQNKKHLFLMPFSFKS